MNLEFEQHAFHQEGHEKESPQQFIGRRIRAVRLLANSDDGGPLEVFLVMRRAPIVWSTILVLENIQSSEDLYDKVNEHEDSLVTAYKREARDASDVITTHNLTSTLRRMGILNPPFNRRRANLVQTEEDSSNEAVGPEEPESLEGFVGDGNETLRQVYQTFKRKQRPPPKGGYPFPKNDQAVTKMGKPPPSPCKVCGSAKHWDRECPDWDAYLEKQRRNVMAVSKDPVEEETDLLYHSAYMVLMDRRLSEKSF
jgi:hypothetical protein